MINLAHNIAKKKYGQTFPNPTVGCVIAKNSKTQVIIVKNEIELSNYFKKNLISNEIIIGMGAGIISKWMRGIKNTL